jgi:hypothetical protein
VQLRTPHSLVTSANPLRRARDDAMELVNLTAAAPPWRMSRNISGGKLLFSLWLGRGFSGLNEKELDGADFFDLFPRHKQLLRNGLKPAT